MASDTVAEDREPKKKKARRRLRRLRRPPLARQTDERIRDEKLYSLGETADFNGSAISSEYAKLAAGKYDPAAIVKDGTRTKIFGWGIKKYRVEHMRPATFKAPKPQPRFDTIRNKPTGINAA